MQCLHRLLFCAASTPPPQTLQPASYQKDKQCLEVFAKEHPKECPL